MSYIINKYNGDQLTVVEDGTINTTLDVKLIGKNYAGYGEAQNENLVFMLENFAGIDAPTKKITGQLWFDSSSGGKLKFYDGSKWRTTGGAEVSDTQPTGLTEGDFWWDTLNKQLKAYDGESFVLVGPESAGATITQMRSRLVRSTTGSVANIPIIQGIVGGDTIFVISKDAAFELHSDNLISGFSKIQQGITLRNTNNESQEGQTQTAHRFWGTSTNSDRLGGSTADEFIRKTGASFDNLVNFEDIGFSVGNTNERLFVYNDGELIPTIHNKLNDQIVFKTTVSGATKTPLKLTGNDLLPGDNLISNIGSSSYRFATVYATVFNGTSTQSDSLNVGGNYRTASTSATSGTIVARTSSSQLIDGITIPEGSIVAEYFSGTATKAFYADLAEKYLADNTYDVGTVLVVGGEKEVSACTIGQRAIGVVSENPAYMMNSGLEGGTYVALKGRVPVKVSGPIKKGDRLIASLNGTASAASSHHNDVFGIALSDNNEPGVKLVECVIL